MDKTQEIWKPVKGYEGRYEVSNYGNVKSLNYLRTGNEKIMALRQNEHGYLLVGLYKDGVGVKRYVHRLVYEAFIGDVPVFNPSGRGNDRMEINHIDENPLNNCAWNLELVSHSVNNNYGKHYQKVSKGNTNGVRAKKVYQYTTDGELVKIWPSTAECDRHGFKSSHISRCCNGKGTNKYKGYIWSYKKIKL